MLLVLRTDGEMVLEVTPHMGYLYCCAKVGETSAVPVHPHHRPPDYLAAMNNNQAFSIAVEKLAGLEVPARRYITSSWPS